MENRNGNAKQTSGSKDAQKRIAGDHGEHITNQSGEGAGTSQQGRQSGQGLRKTSLFMNSEE